MGRFMKGMLTGALLGTAAGMILIPQMNRDTRRRFEKAGRSLTEFTGNLWDGLTDTRR